MFSTTPLKSFWFFFIISKLFLLQRKKRQKRFLYFFKKLCSLLFTNKKNFSYIKGIKFAVSGRIQGKLRSSRFSFYKGALPLQSLSENFKYFFISAKSKRFGVYGFKIWLYIKKKSKKMKTDFKNSLSINTHVPNNILPHRRRQFNAI